MVIQHNMSAMNISRQQGMIRLQNAKSAKKLSSGYRINCAADDASGLQISEKMRWQIRGLNRAVQNIQDGVSLVQVAEGALGEVHNMLQRMNELCIQAANDTNTVEDRTALQKEVDQLASEITRIGKTTSFNGLFLFDKLRPDSADTISVTSLVKCKAADTGYLTDAFEVSANDYRPAAYLDFSGINTSNIDKLYDKSFSFTCSQNCNEAFKFKMVNGGGDSAINLNGKVKHEYVIDIGGMTTGKEIVDKLFSYITANPPTGNGISSVVQADGSLGVSHSNFIKRLDDNNFVLFADSTSSKTTEEAAKKVFPAANRAGMGAIDCGQIVSTKAEVQVNEIKLQTGCLNTDNITISIKRMNANLIGVNELNLSSFQNAGASAELVQSAITEISERRSYLGAQQNRLEHSMDINENTSENTQSAESKLRDADYAKEIVDFSKSNILEQVSEAIFRTNKLRSEDVLRLLQ